ncbi:MAG TPA: radical SAM protein [Candidatus Thermoplasmatota archaeon]
MPIDLLLVDPYILDVDTTGRKHLELYPALGPMYLTSYLRARGFTVEIFDCTFRGTPERALEDLERAVRDRSPRLVGIHTKVITVGTTERLIRALRALGVPVVIGGPDGTIRPERYLEAGADAVVLGEGEATLLEVLERAQADGAAPRDMLGLAWLDGSQVRRTRERPLLAHLDDVPFPAWDAVDMRAYAAAWKEQMGFASACLITSRGCPFNCSWCCKPVFGRTFRQRSVENVMLELRELKERYGVKHVRFADDILPMNAKWLRNLCLAMEGSGLGIRFDCLSRTDVVEADLLERLKAAGGVKVYYGVESGSQKVLDLMIKGTTLGGIREASREARRVGLRQHWFLMVGYPGEEARDLQETVELVRELRPDEYSCTIAYPLKGTPFYEAVKDRLLPVDWTSSNNNRLVWASPYPQRYYRFQLLRVHLTWLLSHPRLGAIARLARPLHWALDRLARAVDPRVANPAYPISREAQRQTMNRSAPTLSSLVAARESLVVLPPSAK